MYQLCVFDPALDQSVPFTSPILECSNVFEYGPDLPPLDQKVGEFNYDIKQNKWVLVRIREDKGSNARGNSLKVARIVLSNILYNISFEMLCTGTGEIYFEYKRLKQYRAMTKFINEVKQSQIRGIQAILSSAATGETPNIVALDLGCGKGQDILKF